MKRRTVFSILEIVVGILFIILGILALMNPGTALSTFVVAYAIAAILMGIVFIIFYVRRSGRSGFAPTLYLIDGILDIVLGIMLLFNNSIGTWVMTLVFPIWFIMSCMSGWRTLVFFVGSIEGITGFRLS